MMIFVMAVNAPYVMQLLMFTMQATALSVASHSAGVIAEIGRAASIVAINARKRMNELGGSILSYWDAIVLLSIVSLN